jgi:hypothetical protein
LVQLKAAVAVLAAVVGPAHIADDKLRFEKWEHQLTLMVNKAEDGPKLKRKAPPAANPQVLASTCAPTAQPSHHAHTGHAPRALRDGQRDCASACCVQATAEDQQTEPSPRVVPNFERKALGMGNRRTEAHVVPRDANVAAAVLPFRPKHHCRRSHHPLRAKPCVVRMGEVSNTPHGVGYFVQILRDDKMMRTRIKSRSEEDDRQFGTC